MNQTELLQYALENGIVNLSYVQTQIEMNKRNEVLAGHKYPIWQGKDKNWRTYLPDSNKQNGRRMVKKSTEEKIIESIIDFYEENLELPKTFDDMYHHWRKVQDTQVSDNTISKYETDYLRYFYNTDFAKKEIANITEEDIKVFIVSTIKQLQLCKKACKTLYLYVKNVFYSARVNHVISEEPLQFLEAKQFYKYCEEKEFKSDARLVSDEDMRELYRQIYNDYENKPTYIPTYAVHLATLTGMRVGELSALKWESITDDYIIINKSEKYNRKTKEYFIDKTKNGKERIFPITPEIKALLDRLKKLEMSNGFICDWVFANENGRIHAPIISSCSKNKCRQVGITEKGIHAYRRTVNSKMRCNGVSSTVTAALLGHTEEVNERYYTFDVTGLEEKSKIVSQINSKMPLAK